MRYLPLTDAERTAMLAAIGASGSAGGSGNGSGDESGDGSGIDALFCDVPEAARFDGVFDLPDGQSEMEVDRAFQAFAAGNLSPARAPCFLGGGAYRHHVPASVDHLIQRGEFLTAYTPYQPEISQGTLQTLYEFQTQVALITGMEVANASMYEGASACAEAVAMAHRLTRRDGVVLAGGLHPHYREATITTGRHGGMRFDTVPPDPGGAGDTGDEAGALAARIDDRTACVVVQNPDVFGRLRDFTELAAAAHASGALLIVAVTEIISLGAVVPPGEMGADIVVGEGQSLGNSLSFGGPYLGLFATRDKYVRQLPGRLCGEAPDADGRRAYTLTLSAREQHIRRAKATSNICTNSGLCALAFSIHLTLLGETGFRQLAAINRGRAAALASALEGLDGVEVLTRPYFNEMTVRLPVPAAPVVERLGEQGLLAGVPLSRLYPERPEFDDLLLVAATECVTDDDIDRLIAGLEEAI